MRTRLVAGAIALGAGSLLAACGTTATAPPPDGTGSPAINFTVTLSVVACELGGWCIAGGTNPTATTAAAAIEVSMGGRTGWAPVAVPPITGTTIAAGSCWSSGCLLGGTGPTGAVVLIVNPSNKVSALTATHPPGSGVAALDCTGPGTCIALVTTTTDTAVFKTSDSGQSWRQLSTLPLALADGTALSCATSAVCAAVGTGPNGASAARSTDGGVRWVGAARPGGLQVLTSVGCSVNLECVATARLNSGATELLHSVSGGLSWAPLATAVPGPDAVACTPSPTCVVAGGSTSGGAISTFTRLRAESARTLAYVPDPIVSVACATPRRCVAVTQASTVSFVA